MPIRTSEFDQIAAELESLLLDGKPKVIAIDGRVGSGKSTLGRFLAWHFNSTLLELDLFLIPGGLKYSSNEIEQVINGRININRSIFVEGAAVLQVLKKINVSADYLIYVRNVDRPKGMGFCPELDKYDDEFSPVSIASHVLIWKGSIR